ncbi:MAG TPA: ABC transporter permease [Dinghuibacter sp.]|uniref:ABC transporter permease n=1 Tax=Dinghuibacter sp. TaxID=2024697 RepID=UPI002D1A33F4|nr:ABC transporter permease [Dinghuibacter sp.]HTJ11921.1 ABC transporter permease [Dinghuibacter sp.]
MLRHYFRITWRQLLKHKVATLIKLAGLSIGMACCMLIVVYIDNQLRYNTFHENYRRIYRVDFDKEGDADRRAMANAPIPVAPAIISEDLKSVEAVARLYNRGGVMEAGTKRFPETRVDFADSAIFKIFSFQFIEGDPRDAAQGIVITDAMAKKYFGREEALGKTLVYEHRLPLKVTGVIKQWPPNSDEQFDCLIPFDDVYRVERPAVEHFLRTNWFFDATDTYVLLKPGESPPSLRNLFNKYADPHAAKSYYVSLRPLQDIHLHSSDVIGNPSTNSIAYIYIFAAIAAMILLIANINFINLSNAQSLTRLGEIGVRKVSGADRKQLIAQFLGEGVLLCALAWLIAWGLAAAALPLADRLTGEVLQLSPPLIAINAGLLAVTALLAGLYPALFITRFRLTALLKGQLRPGGKLIQKGLIVTQFTIAVALVIGAVVIHRQITYLRNKPLGFDKDQLVVLPLFGRASSPVSNTVDSVLRARMNAFENDLRDHAAIRGVTLASVLPGQPIVLGLVVPQGHRDDENIFLSWASVDYDYARTMGLRIVAGRDFSKATGTDNRQAFILNESAVRQFGWTPQEAIGKTMIRGNETDGKRGFVIGVVRDFNFAKLDQPMQPLILDVNVPRFTTFAVRIDAAGVPATLQWLHQTWDRHFSDLVFDYSFLNEDIDALYKAQENLGRLVGFFAALAIFLSAIGVFSLASFIAIRRTREIGIRRVLGARVPDIVALLLADFQRLVLLALLLASPLAWYAMNRWLHDFAYRTTVSWWIFAAAAAGTFLVTVLTVGYQGVRASWAKPVDALRVE